MPPDTTHIPVVIGPQPGFGTLADSTGMLLRQYGTTQASERPQFLLTEFEMFLVSMFIVYLLILRPFFRTIKETRAKVLRREKKIEISEDKYDLWLNRYNPYYASLSPTQKKRFLHRVKEFMASKQFYFHAMVEEEYMPVLISGAAVQLTFGLRNYLMDYFDVIHVMRREYVLNIDKETYYGHVSKNGIHISWNHFLGGYSDYADSVNLGLHEMAHALQFDAALGYEDTHDRSFKQRLNEFSEEGRPIFRAMRQGASHILSDYGATHFDEFWAVSVETFFENPKEFKEKLPNLYREMTELLNQDPLQPDKVLEWEIS
jgi:MtfA peptidase